MWARWGLLLWAASAASAQAAPDSDPSAPGLPDVTVPVPGVRVEAVRPAELADDPTGFTTVVETAERPETGSVEELLSEQVGIQIRRFGGMGQRSEISIRGSTPRQVVILLDGVRLNTAQSGSVDLSTVPLHLLERVEISRGGGSVQVGSDALGGVINLVTPRPGGEPKTSLRLGAGSFDTYEASGWHAGTVGGLELLASYDYFRTKGDFEFQRPVTVLPGATIVPDPSTVRRLNNRVENHASLVKVGREIGERLHVSLANHFFRTSRGQPGLDSGSGETAGQQLEAHERRWRNVASFEAQWAEPFDLPAEGTFRFYHRFEDTRFTDPLPRFGLPLDERHGNGTFGADFEFAGAFERFGVRQRGLVRFDWRRDSLHSNDFLDRARHAGGVMLQDELSVLAERIRVVPAVRFAYDEDFSDEVLPRIGIAATPLPWLRIQANWEESYRVPQFDELFHPDKGFVRGNPALRPEEGEGWDAGVVIAFAELGPLRDVRVEAAYFDQDIDESIVFVPVSSFTVVPLNTGAARLRGYELSAAFDLLGWLRASANHTHLRATRDENRRRLPGRARNETYGRLEIGPPDRWLTLVGEVHRTSTIPVTLSGDRTVSARVVYDASIALDLARLPGLTLPPLERLVVAVDGKNLTDRSIRDAQFFPQTVRTVLLRVEVGW